MNINNTEKIHSILKNILCEGSKIAIFDFPNYSNVGDSAIWLGSITYIKELIHGKIIFMADNNISDQDFPSLPKNAVILIQGGGNFGDLWPRHQQFREMVIRHYPGNRVIQLPQSIHFQDEKNFERCRNILNVHPDFHLIVRDRESLDLANRMYDGPTYLCPDMALCLGAVPRKVAPRHPIVGLMRTDKEKAASSIWSSSDHASLHITDWLDEPFTITRWADARLGWFREKFPRWTGSMEGMRQFLFQRLATERFKRGCDILSSGEVVITDRLHGHIMCCLLGIPHVVLDNSYRKIGNFRDAWGTGAGLCLTADSFQSAYDMAKTLLNLHKK